MSIQLRGRRGGSSPLLIVVLLWVSSRLSRHDRSGIIFGRLERLSRLGLLVREWSELFVLVGGLERSFQRKSTVKQNTRVEIQLN